MLHRPRGSCGVMLIGVMMMKVLGAAEGYGVGCHPGRTAPLGALFWVPQGEKQGRKGGAAGSGQLQGRGILGSPGTRHPRDNPKAVGRAAGGSGGILVSVPTCLGVLALSGAGNHPKTPQQGGGGGPAPRIPTNGA